MAGAGGVGGTIAAYLSRVAEVRLFVRRERAGIGLSFVNLHGEKSLIDAEPVSDPAAIADVDVIIFAAKGHQLPELSHAFRHLANRGQLAVFVQNGLPWWYLDGRIERPSPLDPEAALAEAFKECAAGVAYFGGELVGPELVRQTGAGQLVLGMARGQHDARLSQLVRDLAAGGMDVADCPEISSAVLDKLVVNVTLNAVAVLTGASIDEMLDSENLRPLLLRLADEVSAIARADGHETMFDFERQRRLCRPGQLSSTLSDLQKGNEIEFEALFGSVKRLGRLLGVETPMLDTVSTLIAQRAQKPENAGSIAMQIPTASPEFCDGVSRRKKS